MSIGSMERPFLTQSNKMPACQYVDMSIDIVLKICMN